MPLPLIDIVIPVYNEAGNIGKALRAIHSKVSIPYQVNIVYDFDEDNTLPEAKAVSQELGIQVRYIKNHYGRGVLGAIKTGLQTSTSPWIVVTMADLSDPPEVIVAMYKAATDGGADVVCASRYMKGGKQIGGPLIKRTLSRMAGLSLYWMAGIPTHDSTNSFKLYSHKVINNIPIESTGGFELGLELVVKAHLKGFKVVEVPTTWVDRTEGESRFKLIKWSSLYMRWYCLALKKRFMKSGSFYKNNNINK